MHQTFSAGALPRTTLGISQPHSRMGRGIPHGVSTWARPAAHFHFNHWLPPNLCFVPKSNLNSILAALILRYAYSGSFAKKCSLLFPKNPLPLKNWLGKCLPAALTPENKVQSRYGRMVDKVDPTHPRLCPTLDVFHPGQYPVTHPRL